MSNSSPGARAVSDFEIDDVFLVETNCQVDPQFNQTQLFENVVFQHRVGLGPTIYGQSRVAIDDGDPDVHIVRYLVSGEVRLLKSEAVPDGETVADEDVLATIKLTYAADYRCSSDMVGDQDAIRSFGKNAVFHVWPYLREGIHDCAARMRMPRFTVPMLKPTKQQGPDAQDGPDNSDGK